MDKQRAKDIIACRCAQELKDGYVVNLGIGIPTQCARYFPEGVDITLHASWGSLVKAPHPPRSRRIRSMWWMLPATPPPLSPAAAIVDSATNFGLIRGGHVDACVLGALEADAEGSFGNWLIPGKKLTGMGGAMDLVNGSKTVILAMIHTQGDKPKIVEKCTLPLTGYKVVDMIVTELCVLKVTPEGLELAEYNPSWATGTLRFGSFRRKPRPSCISLRI